VSNDILTVNLLIYLQLPTLLTFAHIFTPYNPLSRGEIGFSQDFKELHKYKIKKTSQQENDAERISDMVFAWYGR
jgi:hypothetical protein